MGIGAALRFPRAGKVNSHPGGTFRAVAAYSQLADVCKNDCYFAYHQNPEALVDFLPICDSSRFYKRQAIRSIFAQLLAYFQRRVSGIISDGSGTQALVCASGGSGVDKPVTRMSREYLSHPCLLLESSTGH